MLQEVTETTNDVITQQSSAITNKSTNITKESLERESIITITTSKTSPSWMSEIIHVTVSEGSGEDESNSKDWQHSTEPDKKLLFTAAVVSVHDSAKGAMSVPSFGDRFSSGSTSSFKSSVISEKVQKIGVGRCTANSQLACHELAICAEESGECICKSGYHGDGYSICMLVSF